MSNLIVPCVALVIAIAALTMSIRQYHRLTGRWLPFGPPKDQA